MHVSRAALGSATDDALHRDLRIAALLRSYYPDENRPLTYVYDKGVFTNWGVGGG